MPERLSGRFPHTPKSPPILCSKARNRSKKAGCLHSRCLPLPGVEICLDPNRGDLVQVRIDVVDKLWAIEGGSCQHTRRLRSPQISRNGESVWLGDTVDLPDWIVQTRVCIEEARRSHEITMCVSGRDMSKHSRSASLWVFRFKVSSEGGLSCSRKPFIQWLLPWCLACL